MSNTILEGVAGLHEVSQAAERYLPEPARTGVGMFRDAVRLARSAVSEVSENTLEISDEYRELIEKQLELQKQMQLTSMVSNIHKTEHEAKMAAIRNIRAG